MKSICVGGDGSLKKWRSKEVDDRGKEIEGIRRREEERGEEGVKGVMGE